MLIGPNINLNVKLWAFFVAIMKQTGASGTWVFPPAHDIVTIHRPSFKGKVCKNWSVGLFRFGSWNKELVSCFGGAS